MPGGRACPGPPGRWALDSGCFAELNLHGGWQFTEGEYVAPYRFGRFRPCRQRKDKSEFRRMAGPNIILAAEAEP
ncbi:MAG: deazapurine DNA modification protein DpdA family protein [Actinomycetota bacterium]